MRDTPQLDAFMVTSFQQQRNGWLQKLARKLADETWVIEVEDYISQSGILLFTDEKRSLRCEAAFNESPEYGRIYTKKTIEEELRKWGFAERAKAIPEGRLVTDLDIAGIIGWSASEKLSALAGAAVWSEELLRPDRNRFEYATCHDCAGCECQELDQDPYSPNFIACRRCDDCDHGWSAYFDTLRSRGFTDTDFALAQDRYEGSPAARAKAQTRLNNRIRELNGVTLATGRQAPKDPYLPAAAFDMASGWNGGSAGAQKAKLYRLAWVELRPWPEVAAACGYAGRGLARDGAGAAEKAATDLRARLKRARSISSASTDYGANGGPSDSAVLVGL